MKSLKSLILTDNKSDRIILTGTVFLIWVLIMDCFIPKYLYDNEHYFLFVIFFYFCSLICAVVFFLQCYSFLYLRGISLTGRVIGIITTILSAVAACICYCGAFIGYYSVINDW